jgi:hypothetical protein
MQISSLEHAFSLSPAKARSRLLSSVCEGLTCLFDSAPLGGLCGLEEWEHGALDKISTRLAALAVRTDEVDGEGDVPLAKGVVSGGGGGGGSSSRSSDQVNLLLLGQAVQRGSLAAALAALLNLTRRPGDPLASSSGNCAGLAPGLSPLIDEDDERRDEEGGESPVGSVPGSAPLRKLLR